MIDDEPMLPAIISPELTPMPISSWAFPFGLPISVELAQLATISTAAAPRARHARRRRRRAEQRHHHVADELIDRPVMPEHHLDHPGEVLVQLRDERFGVAFLGDGGESADVREQHRHLAPLAAELRELGMFDQLVIDVARDVSAEQRLQTPLLASFDEIR